MKKLLLLPIIAVTTANGMQPLARGLAKNAKLFSRIAPRRAFIDSSFGGLIKEAQAPDKTNNTAIKAEKSDQYKAQTVKVQLPPTNAVATAEAVYPTQTETASTLDASARRIISKESFREKVETQEKFIKNGLKALLAGGTVGGLALGAKEYSDSVELARLAEKAKIAEAARVAEESKLAAECEAALEAQEKHGATIEAAKSDAGWYGLSGYKNRAAAWATGNADMALPKNQARQWNRVPGSSYANRGANWAWNKVPAIRKAQ